MSLYSFIITIVCLGLMIGVAPLLLKLRPNKKINYLDIDSENNVRLNENLDRAFEQIKLVKNEEGKIESLLITPREFVNSVDITLACDVLNSHTNIKGLKIRFKPGQEVKVSLTLPCDQIAIFLNQTNNGMKQDHIIQHVNRLNVELFIHVMIVLAIIPCITNVYDIIRNAYAPLLELRVFTILLTVLFIIIIYLVLRFMTYKYLGKYIYGGKFNG